MIPVLVIVGPTASGKTWLSVEIAKELGAEIVSADSMQIYKHMNIATAKPTKEEMQGVPHHMMDFLEISQNFSVADYVNMAGEKIKDIYSRGKIPIVVGGTGLYIDSLLENINFTQIASDESIRQELNSIAREKGNQYVLDMLDKVDHELAQKLHPNNTGRIIRALEVYRITGITMTEHQIDSRKEPSPYKTYIVGLGFSSRSVLYERINRRVDVMLKQGLVEEAKNILSVRQNTTAFSAIGYKELAEYFDGYISLDEAVENIKRESRRYAKRQITWFKRNAKISWINVDEYDKEKVCNMTKNGLHESNIL